MNVQLILFLKRLKWIIASFPDRSIRISSSLSYLIEPKVTLLFSSRIISDFSSPIPQESLLLPPNTITVTKTNFRSFLGKFRSWSCLNAGRFWMKSGSGSAERRRRLDFKWHGGWIYSPSRTGKSLDRILELHCWPDQWLEEVEKESRAAIQTGPGKSDSSVERLAANEMKRDRQLKVTPAITF